MDDTEKNFKKFIIWFIFIIFVIFSGMWVNNQWGSAAAVKYFAGHSLFIITWILRNSFSNKETEK